MAAAAGKEEDVLSALMDAVEKHGSDVIPPPPAAELEAQLYFVREEVDKVAWNLEYISKKTKIAWSA